MDTLFSRATALRRSLSFVPFLRTRQNLRVATILAAGFVGAFLAYFGMQFQGVPNPALPLEHANLLNAETFASFRVANPPHPAGRFLATYFTLQEPSYASVAPPAPGVLLATGIWLGGDPVYGLWIGSFFFCAAVAWMLLGLHSPRWALVGAAFAAVWFCFLSYWGQSFASPLATGIGFALLLGALIRYSKTGGASCAAVFGTALAWLWFCSPLALVVSGAIPLWLFAREVRRRNRKGALALMLPPLVAAAAVQFHINNRVTGDWTTRPATAYAERYDQNPRFLWEPVKMPPKFDHWRMEQYDVMVREAGTHLPLPVVQVWRERVSHLLFFYLGLPGLLLVAAHLLLGPSRWPKHVALAGGATLLVPIILFIPPLGESAALGVFGVALIAWSFRRVCLERARRGMDSTGLLALLAAAVFLAVFHRGIGFETQKDVSQHRAHQNKLLEHLNADPAPHLVVVEYNATVNPNVEYVYNGANPDSQHVVWARWHPTADMGPLFEHYKDRKLWHLNVKPGAGEPELRPFQWNPGPGGVAR